jgi:hypothetical protein
MLVAILLIACAGGCDDIDLNAPAFADFTFSGQQGKAKINAKKRTVDIAWKVTRQIQRKFTILN